MQQYILQSAPFLTLLLKTLGPTQSVSFPFLSFYDAGSLQFYENSKDAPKEWKIFCAMSISLTPNCGELSLYTILVLLSESENWPQNTMG